MATVTLAEDTLLRRPVALKKLHTSGDQRELARLRREALVGASLSHPNLVTVYDVYNEEDGQLVIVLEYVPGETLHQAIRRGGAIAPRHALDVLGQLAAALDAIHARGVVHRDVKPANVLLGTNGVAKLADLGIAAAADRTQTTAGAEVAGSFSYMAPEQLEGRPSNAAIDNYALAAVAFEMLSGRRARSEANPVALAHAISTQPPPDLSDAWSDAPALAADVLRAGMSADPAKRPRTAGELVVRLAQALDARTTQRPAALKGDGAHSPRAHRRPAPAAAPPSARRVARARPAPRAAYGSRRYVAGVVAGVPPKSDASVARHPGDRAPRVLTRPAREEGASGGRTVRVGAILALVLVAAAVALAAALGSGGGSARKTVARTAGKAHRSGARHSATAAHGKNSYKRSSAQASSTNDAAAKSQPPAAVSATNNAAASSPPAAGPTIAASSVPQTAASPAGAVEAFYGHAAHHEYSAAWLLADANMRNQLAGFASFRAQQSAVRSITFRRADVLPGAAGKATSATVALETTAVLVDRTEQCGGTARLVRSATAGWLLDGISINCTP